jgi:transcriptional regulator with XRE-family HTH domain
LTEKKGVNMGMSEDSFKERMALAAKLAGNATELSRRTGISRRAIGTYLSGASDPTRQRLVSIAQTAGVSVEWLATGVGDVMASAGERKMLVFPGLATGSLTSLRSEPMPSEITIPHYTVTPNKTNQRVITMLEEIEHITINPEYLGDVSYSHHSNLQMLTLKGRHLSPVGIGNMVIIDKGQRIKEGEGAGVYLLKLDGEMQIRIAYMHSPDEIKVMSCSNDQSPLMVNHNNHAFDVLGKIVWTCGYI